MNETELEKLSRKKIEDFYPVLSFFVNEELLIKFNEIFVGVDNELALKIFKKVSLAIDLEIIDEVINYLDLSGNSAKYILLLEEVLFNDNLSKEEKEKKITLRLYGKSAAATLIKRKANLLFTKFLDEGGDK